MENQVRSPSEASEAKDTTDDWKGGYDDVRPEQLLAFARLSASDKLKVIEDMLEAFQDRMPKHEFLESW